MIRDWDLWPWMVADGAGELALLMLRAERSVLRIAAAITEELLPIMRRFAASVEQATRGLQRLA